MENDQASENKNPVVHYTFYKVVTLAELEKAHILTALKHTGGDKREAAKLLGVSLKTLYNKLNEYNKPVEVTVTGEP